MIRPPGWDGAAFSEGGDGDIRNDPMARGRVSVALGIAEDWAFVRQVHGGEVARVDRPGDAGEADAVWTTVEGLAVSIFTADCFGVVLHAAEAVGVAHCGWRGTVAGVAQGLKHQMAKAGHDPVWGAIGPGIGPCCFEVGREVSSSFDGYRSETTWGTTSVDLVAALRDQLEGVELWEVGRCTRHEEGWFSHRRDGDPRRLATIGWVS